ncbi:Bug family tripartite tricarboxylate transporter substrate binding protein [Paenalcaligenes hominis]|uniref:Tripartite-type tricarboxylate transporter receptor subunit TctC n=1 Tax=Paenalcaligenes hominis TaxID=643674 RepID=A0ABX0WTF2_9BURK|nr:tripartite tricarboxylate transporter substrate binding protein [Paenalcaligenes hominis]NJB66011.1 tripartite-type tricarboxylate transporter receptor subunit TctC [Paenalcaligenes hominis]GGE71397.1 hypothetical protein GCM10007278_19470 [Paenalcaligenes hominis]
MKKFTLRAILTSLAVMLSLPVAAQDAFPKKPIRLVVPFEAGGGSDGLARAIQSEIESQKLLPVPFVVTNATGAGGAVGSRQVLRATPDGYTILQIHQELFAAAALGRVDYTPLDFEPVIQVSEACLFMAVAADSPLNSFDDFLKKVKTDGANFRQGDEIGGATHFPSVRLMNLIDTEWVVVPTGATSKRFTALKGGFADMALMSPLWIERSGGEVRPLAVLGEERYEQVPDLPTAKELGYDVKSCLNRRYWAPKGTPEQNIAVLADAIEAAANSERVRSYLDRSGEKLKIVRGEQLKQEIAAEYEDFIEVADAVKGGKTN